MLLNDKIKLNKFRKVNIPDAKTLYMRGMPMITAPEGAYTGDNNYVPEIGNNKAQALYTAEEWAKYEAMMAEHDRRQAEAAQEKKEVPTGEEN